MGAVRSDIFRGKSLQVVSGPQKLSDVLFSSRGWHPMVGFYYCLIWFHAFRSDDMFNSARVASIL